MLPFYIEFILSCFRGSTLYPPPPRLFSAEPPPSLPPMTADVGFPGWAPGESLPAFVDRCRAAAAAADPSLALGHSKQLLEAFVCENFLGPPPRPRLRGEGVGGGRECPKPYGWWVFQHLGCFVPLLFHCKTALTVSVSILLPVGRMQCNQPKLRSMHFKVCLM